jgi:hypothetical protein
MGRTPDCQPLRTLGRRFARVRVSMPLTDYSCFGVWCAQFTNGAGEDIRYLTRGQAQAEGLPAHDYWLFDSRTLVQLHFDDEDHFLGGELIEASAVTVQHNYWRDAAWHKAAYRDDLPQNSTSVSNVYECAPRKLNLAYRASRTRHTPRGCHHGEYKPRRPCGQGAARRDGDPR